MSDIVVQGLSATVIGMGIVVFVLALLMCVLFLFKYLAPKPKAVPTAPAKAAPPAPATKSNVVQYDLTPADTDKGASVMMPSLASGSADDLIAVISAAVAVCMEDCEGTPVIKSITPVPQAGTAASARASASGWNIAARRENHRGLY